MAAAISSSPRRGVSLVEALVALAIMSFGMLALVGVQTTMRLNSDLAKQRSEATRIATEELERLRSFIAVPPVANLPGASYDEIASRTLPAYQPPDGIGNTTYSIERTVNDVAGLPQKVVTVTVRWQDRSDTEQSVTLDTVIAAVDPTLAALLSVASKPSPGNQQRGRHVSIPEGAADQGDGTSHFTPPGSYNVRWVFNNLTGLLRVCDANGADCVPATLLSGSVQFHLPASLDLPVDGDAEKPVGPSSNLVGGVVGFSLADPKFSPSMVCYATQIPASGALPYFCAVGSTHGWGGRLEMSLVDNVGTDVDIGNLDTALKVCRYTSKLKTADDINTALYEPDYTLNADHPRTYCMEKPGIATVGVPCTGLTVTSNLINQNFLVIRSGLAECPGHSATSLALIKYNTLQHQP